MSPQTGFIKGAGGWWRSVRVEDWGRGERVQGETVERKMEEHFNSMIQQRYQFPQMAGWLLLTYIGGE